MWVSKYVVWFVLYSVAGWVWETIYCTIQEHKWDNRGFLYGPLCPIYGTGVTAMILSCQLMEDAGYVPEWWQVLLASMVGSAVLEYVTSWALERIFHARWWDYSDMPLNIDGRICLPASVLFGLAGLLVVFVLYQPTMHLTDDVPPELVELLSLVLVALVATDATLTASALTQFAHMTASVAGELNAQMDKMVEGLEEDAERARVRVTRAMDAATRGAVRRIYRFGDGKAQDLEVLRREVRAGIAK